MFLICVYYSRATGSEGPSSELWDTAESLEVALAKAQGVSAGHAEHTFAIEGGDYEPGGWDNPVFKAGERLR